MHCKLHSMRQGGLATAGAKPAAQRCPARVHRRPRSPVFGAGLAGARRFCPVALPACGARCRVISALEAARVLCMGAAAGGCLAKSGWTSHSMARWPGGGSAGRCCQAYRKGRTCHWTDHIRCKQATQRVGACASAVGMQQWLCRACGVLTRTAGPSPISRGASACGQVGNTREAQPGSASVHLHANWHACHQRSWRHPPTQSVVIPRTALPPHSPLSEAQAAQCDPHGMHQPSESVYRPRQP